MLCTQALYLSCWKHFRQMWIEPPEGLTHFRPRWLSRLTFLQLTLWRTLLPIGSSLWEWRLDPSQQKGEIYWSFRFSAFWLRSKCKCGATEGLRIPSAQHKTNEWILYKLKVDRELLDRVKSLKLGFYGHTTRKYESLEKEIVQGCVPSYRNRSRQRRHWTDDIAE